MKKVIKLVIASLLISIIGVIALNTTTFLIPKGEGTAALSTENSVSGNSARLFAPLITAFPPSNEGTIRIEFPNGMTLAELQNISWTQFVAQGYAAHVDVLLDTLGDGTVNDSLVFEYAKVKPLDCDDTADYPVGPINTFGDKGIVDENAYAWLNSNVPGPCGDSNFDSNHKSLANWKLFYPNAKIIALEIEVDGWISQSEAFIDNVMVNGELIQNFDGVQTGNGQVVTDLTLIINPISLIFGDMQPGESKTLPTILTVGQSNLDVSMIQVTPSQEGGIFNENNVLFSVDDINFADVSEIGIINIPSETSKNLFVKLTIPTATPAGPFSGTITYTVMQA